MASVAAECTRLQLFPFPPENSRPFSDSFAASDGRAGYGGTIRGLFLEQFIPAKNLHAFRHRSVPRSETLATLRDIRSSYCTTSFRLIILVTFEKRTSWLPLRSTYEHRSKLAPSQLIECTSHRIRNRSRFHFSLALAQFGSGLIQP